jgi:hypothetical protein
MTPRCGWNRASPRAESTAPWLLIARRFMRRPRFQPLSELPASGQVREF